MLLRIDLLLGLMRVIDDGPYDIREFSGLLGISL